MLNLSSFINYICFMLISGFILLISGLFFIKIKYNPDNYFFIKPLVKSLIKIFVFFAIGGFLVFLASHNV